MNSPDDQQIENLLRRPPQPVPPPDLKEKLFMQIESNSATRVPAIQPGNWLGRWWPTLVPAGFCLACAVIFAVQQNQIRDRKQNIQTLSAQLANPPPSASPQPSVGGDNSASLQSKAEQAEVARLNEQVNQLSAEISKLEQLRAENKNLQAQLAAPRNGLTPEETDAMDKARARAELIQCVNHLKQIGLAARIWAGDNGDVAPPDFLSMSNELSTPKILVCPSDTGHQVAASFFAGFSSANYSYDYLTSGVTNAWQNEPTRVMCRCPIHGTILLVDGSVQSSIGKDHPEWLVTRDGKLYFEPTQTLGH